MVIIFLANQESVCLSNYSPAYPDLCAKVKELASNIDINHQVSDQTQRVCSYLFVLVYTHYSDAT